MNTEEILKRDSLTESEKLLGDKHWDQFNKGEQYLSMLKFMADNDEKKQHLKAIGDTYFGISWTDFKKMLTDYGFKVGLSYELETGFEDNNIEEAIIYYHIEKGLILWATSYWNQTSVNGGVCYCEIKSNGSKEDNHIIWQWMSSGCTKENRIVESSFDVREGLFFRLEKLGSAGKFQKVWNNKDRFIRFLDWNESKVEGYDYEAITKEKISRCPKEMQNIIYGKEKNNKKTR